MQDYIGRQPLDDPLVLQALIWRHALVGVPLKTLPDEIHEGGIWHVAQLLHYVLEAFLFLLEGQDLQGCRHGIILELGEELLALGVLQDLLWRHADHVNNELQLLFFVGAGKERESRVKLYHNAAKAPHVDLLRVGKQAKYYVGCPVKPALDVGVDYFVLEAAAAEIGDHDATLVLSF